jgi:uncharacterized membrane protein YidH (DUF202 family)
VIACRDSGFTDRSFNLSRSLPGHLGDPREATQRLHELAIAFGLALLVLGVVTLALAGASHWQSVRALQRGASPGVGKWPLSLALGLLVAILGVVGLALLFSY